MKKITFRRPTVKPAAVFVYLAYAACCLFLNFALPQKEPVSFALFYAALACGLNPLLCGGGYLLASAPLLSLSAFLSCLVQTAFLVLVFGIYKRFSRRPKAECVVYLICAQLPFVFLFPHAGYGLFPFAPVYQKMILAAFLLLLSLLTEGALDALLHRAFRCKLSAGQLAEICLFGFFTGLGMIAVLGNAAYYALSLAALFLCVILLKNAACVPFALALSLPLCVEAHGAAPVAEYAALACAGVLLVPYGKPAAALALSVVFCGVQYFEGLYAQSALVIALTLSGCILPVLALSFLPERAYKKLRASLLFYRERALPRIAINRNRRAVGEQLYEVSSLFREIENAFTFRDRPDGYGAQMTDKLRAALCLSCPHRRKCEEKGIGESIAKLVAVGKAKGRVNLIDMPADVASCCVNSAGMLFALNKQLAEYRRFLADAEAAKEGRKLLAEQARGVSEVLRDIALQQSEEFVFSDEEQTLASALAENGILSSEIFLYGEGRDFTVSVTLRTDVNGKRLCKIAGKALNVPLTLSEKIPLTNDRSCFILKRKAAFDAAFGIAAKVKSGESASGDTHSIIKIDERRFLVALSDGMGSGENARDVSDKTLNLLESFYKAKMPSETVLSTVNRLIAFSAEETFSCLDLAAVNLDTGAADIVKIGSPMGFLISGEELRVLEGESLPIGMLEAVHPATLRVNMKENDFLLFMSDGVTTAFGSSAELCAYLSALRPHNPQSLAEEILSSAVTRYGGTCEDDMTVLAVKLTKTA